MRAIGYLILIPAILAFGLSALGLLISFLNGSEQLRYEYLIVLALSGSSTAFIVYYLDSQKAGNERKITPLKQGQDTKIKYRAVANTLPCETRIAGVTHKNKDSTSRQTILEKINLNAKLTLLREPDNPHDRNAIKVLSPLGCVGYLPKELAAKLSEENTADLMVTLIQKGQLETGVYWAKIRVVHSSRSDGINELVKRRDPASSHLPYKCEDPADFCNLRSKYEQNLSENEALKIEINKARETIIALQKKLTDLEGFSFDPANGDQNNKKLRDDYSRMESIDLQKIKSKYEQSLSENEALKDEVQNVRAEMIAMQNELSVLDELKVALVIYHKENKKLQDDLVSASRKITSLRRVASGSHEKQYTSKPKKWSHGKPGSDIEGSTLYRGYCYICGEPIRVVRAEEALEHDCGCANRTRNAPALS